MVEIRCLLKGTLEQRTTHERLPLQRRCSSWCVMDTRTPPMRAVAMVASAVGCMFSCWPSFSVLKRRNKMLGTISYLQPRHMRPNMSPMKRYVFLKSCWRSHARTETKKCQRKTQARPRHTMEQCTRTVSTASRKIGCNQDNTFACTPPAWLVNGKQFAELEETRSRRHPQASRRLPVASPCP